MTTDNTKNLFKKIKALLSKTTEAGCTEAEAFAALETANRLMAEHNISILDLETEGETLDWEKQEFFRGKGAKLRNEVHWCLSVAIDRFTNVRIWRSKRRGGMMYAGYTSDRIFARWLHDTLTDFVLRATKRYVDEAYLIRPIVTQEEEGGFALGCVKRINERLAALTADRAPQHAGAPNALVVQKNALVQRFLQDRGVDIVSGKTLLSGSAAAVAAGRAAADAASFSRPVTGAAPLRLR